MVYVFGTGGIEKFGVSEFNGGGSGPFNIAHGMTPQPDYAFVQAVSADAHHNTGTALTIRVTIDSTNIIVNYNANTTAGTNNVDLRWMAGRKYSIRDEIRAVNSDSVGDE